MSKINEYDSGGAPEKLSSIFKDLDSILNEYKKLLREKGKFYEGTHPISGESITDYEYKKYEDKIKSFKQTHHDARWGKK